MVVELGNPFELRELDCFLGLVRRAAVGQLSLLGPVDCFGREIVVVVTPAARRGFNVGLGQAFAVPSTMLASKVPCSIVMISMLEAGSVRRSANQHSKNPS